MPVTKDNRDLNAREEYLEQRVETLQAEVRRLRLELETLYQVINERIQL